MGCLLEATKGGKEPLNISGHSRTYLEDEDVVIFTGYCEVSKRCILIYAKLIMQV